MYTAADVLQNVKEIDFGNLALDEELCEKRPITKFPPPPYLPGELDRRAALISVDKEAADRQVAYEEY